MMCKTTFLRIAWDKKREATVHSTAMSNRPASRKLVQFESVLPRREYRMNSRFLHSTFSLSLQV